MLNAAQELILALVDAGMGVSDNEKAWTAAHALMDRGWVAPQDAQEREDNAADNAAECGYRMGYEAALAAVIARPDVPSGLAAKLAALISTENRT